MESELIQPEIDESSKAILDMLAEAIINEILKA